MPAPYTGGCQCGSVRYVLAEPIRLAACHCKECQGESGSAFGMSMPVNKDSLTVTGRTKQFTRIADSGNEVAGVLCPDCGVRIEPWEEDGELWRRQKVILPDNIASHTRAGQQFRPGRAFAPA